MAVVKAVFPLVRLGQVPKCMPYVLLLGLSISVPSKHIQCLIPVKLHDISNSCVPFSDNSLIEIEDRVSFIFISFAMRIDIRADI
jgi:hypothetical protein